MVNLADVLLHIHPTANPRVDFVVRNDGEGSYIAEWNLPGQQPTQAQLDAAALALAAAKQAADAAKIKDVADASAAKAYAKLTALRGMSPAQVQAWVAANVTNLAQAQDAIATLAIAVSILARKL